MNNLPEHSELGKSSAYVAKYDASLLFPIARLAKREEIGVGAAPPFFDEPRRPLPPVGVDVSVHAAAVHLGAKVVHRVVVAHVMPSSLPIFAQREHSRSRPPGFWRMTGRSTMSIGAVIVGPF